MFVMNFIDIGIEIGKVLVIYQNHVTYFFLIIYKKRSHYFIS